MNSEKLPLVLSCGLFNVISSNEDKIIAKCKMCVGANAGLISASTKATSNFITHVKRKHPEKLDLCSIQKKGIKRPALQCNSEQPDKVTKINSPFSIAAAAASKKSVSNEKCNQLVIDYIIEEIRPLCTVDKPAFRKMLEGVSNGGFTPVCRQTLAKQISTRVEACKSNLIDIFAEIDFVCTTADIWSKNNKSYFGVTAHIIVSDTLKRKSFVLACSRIRFAHTYKEIGKLLSHIHASFRIKNDKISGTVTDNATNFGKAFRVFSCNDETDDNSELQLESQENEVDIVNVDFSNIGVNDEFEDDVIVLPPQFRCCSHTLNLIATTDIQKTVSTNKTILRKIHYSTFAKLTSIWNSVSRSTKSSDEVERICSRKLNVPCPTRWNSLFDCISTILALKKHLDSICDAIKVTKLKSVEFDFLQEYFVVMKPLATAIDILQGENQLYLGYVLPTIFQLMHNEQKIENLKFCAELRDSIQTNVKKRFSHILDFSHLSSRPYILATCSLPQFKLNWINSDKDKGNYAIVRELFMSEVQKHFLPSNDNTQIRSDSPLENNCPIFDYMDTPKPDDNLSENASHIEFLAYLNSPNKKLLSVKDYPAIFKIFKKYNVLLPSSAPVERMFSSGGQILTPRRNKLSDEQFEKLLFLKYNGGL